MKRQLLKLILVAFLLIISISLVAAQEPPTATITASLLNVRAEPSPTATILFRITKNTSHPILAVNRSNGWLQISVNGVPGWINEIWANINTLDGIPVVQADRLLPESPTNTIATIRAPRLNVRSGPGIGFDVLVTVGLGETYTVIGRNAANTWIQIFANGVEGWVNRGYTSASRSSVLNVPILEGSVIAPVNPVPPNGQANTAQPTGDPGQPTATITAVRLNVRAEPSVLGDIVLQVGRPRSFPILAINRSNGWLQITVNGIPGWINENFAVVNNLDGIPVVQADRLLSEAPTNTTATITAGRLNVRSGPGAGFDILTVVGNRETYTVVGRTSDSSWIQIFANGVTGWVNRGWTTASRSSILNVPIVAN